MIPGRARLVAGGVLVLLLVGITALAPLVQTAERSEPGAAAARVAPSWAHPLGTDQLGRDLAARIVTGARTSLLVAVLAVLLATLVGSAVGLFAGLSGGPVDWILMRLVDFVTAFPQVMLVIALAAVLGGGSLWLVILVIGMTTWMSTARLVRAEVLSLREREFVQVARAEGAGPLRLMLHHILPNAASVIVIAATLRVGHAILLETSLGFLGLGVPAETPTWGRIVWEGWTEMREAWWIATFAGIAITWATVGFNFLGDGLRDRLQPGRG